MTSLLRSLFALLPLTVVALWLVPLDRALPDQTEIHAARVSAPTAGLASAPATIATLVAEAETEDDDRDPRPDASRPTSRPTTPRVSPLDMGTRARTDAPLYTVRRSGQAHRSAP